METGKIVSFSAQGNEVQVQYERLAVTVRAVTPDILNVFVPCKDAVRNSKAVEGDRSVPVSVTAEQNGEKLLIGTKELTLCLGTDLYLAAKDGKGQELFHTYEGERTPLPRLSERSMKILAAEGHDVAKFSDLEYPVQLVMAMDEGDNFYGLGDKSGFLNKKYYEYENWNTDNPQAHTEDFHALYKSVPFLICAKRKGVYGLFFDNTYRSSFNLGKESADYFFYAAADGNLDLYITGGACMPDVVKGYTYLTGRTPLPQLWTLGYQQSRWGYESADDMREIAAAMRKNDIPCDAIHFDIDYMQQFKVFTWDEENYGKPGELIAELARDGFKTVTIIDPGTKEEEGYFMHDEGVEKGFFATDTDGKVYTNVVWPGKSNYPDFGRSEVRRWWGDHHRFLTDIGVAGVWNDMNEPASFEGELPADVVFHDEERTTDHAEMHNVYGHCMSRATFEGLRAHTDERPFIITRACYAGTQKYATVWTGDNQSLWAHLQMMIPQLCNLGMSGFAFAGTDIGGFGADTTPELLTRWIEAACFAPLFRNHAAKGSKPQEPWRFDEQTLSIYRDYVKLRYRFLPYLYDLFWQGESTGLPVMRPLVLHYEDDANVHNLNDEFLVGTSLLVAPVVEQGKRCRAVYLPEGTWYDLWTGEAREGRQYILKDAPLDVCPMFVKAGSLIPTFEPVSYVGEKPYRRLELLAAPGEASCVHFQDNGKDYGYREGRYNLYRFTRTADGRLETVMEHENYPRYDEISVVEIGNGAYAEKE